MVCSFHCWNLDRIVHFANDIPTLTFIIYNIGLDFVTFDIWRGVNFCRFPYLCEKILLFFFSEKSTVITSKYILNAWCQKAYILK